MSYRRTRIEVNHYRKTKAITMLVEYEGKLEDNEAIAQESMALLIGDAWHSYANALGLKPLETMKMIDECIRNSGKAP